MIMKKSILALFVAKRIRSKKSENKFIEEFNNDYSNLAKYFVFAISRTYDQGIKESSLNDTALKALKKEDFEMNGKMVHGWFKTTLFRTCSDNCKYFNTGQTLRQEDLRDTIVDVTKTQSVSIDVEGVDSFLSAYPNKLHIEMYKLKLHHNIPYTEIGRTYNLSEGSVRYSINLIDAWLRNHRKAIIDRYVSNSKEN